MSCSSLRADYRNWSNLVNFILIYFFYPCTLLRVGTYFLRHFFKSFNDFMMLSFDLLCDMLLCLLALYASNITQGGLIVWVLSPWKLFDINFESLSIEFLLCSVRTSDWWYFGRTLFDLTLELLFIWILMIAFCFFFIFSESATLLLCTRIMLHSCC